ncbi:MAG: LON peptidase substrate-binding domain-containing protein [Ekhidna sp.]
MHELPLFPLNIVAFPGEAINLHIFEPRYRQLIADCTRDGSTFGIPSHVLNTIDIGTEVKIVEISKEYPDGRMDIKTQGLRVFKVEEFHNPWKDRLYAGGAVTLLEEENDKDLTQLILFKELVSELFGWLKEVNIDVSEIQSVFDIGHKIGLKLEEEYMLLDMRKESERLRFATNHLQKLIPSLERAQSAQDRIKQNGHFKHLNPLTF